MMTDNEFTNGVWEKYNNYVNTKYKDKFFVKNQYKKIKFHRKLSLPLNFIIAMIACVGVTYAGVVTYKFIQKSTYTDFEKNRGYDYNQNMIPNNSMYYKKIYSYDEYLEAKKIWNNLVEIQPDDFHEYFIMIIAGENYDTISLYIEDIYVENEELNIKLRKTEKWDKNNTVISTKISKNLDRETVNLINIPNKANTLGKYTDIENITIDYTIEDAKRDNCFVVDKNKIVSDDPEQLDKFIHNCENSIEDCIRIYAKEPDGILIEDLEYKNSRINMTTKSIKFDSGESKTYYRTGNKIRCAEDNKLSSRYYSLKDEIGNGAIFCIVHF